MKPMSANYDKLFVQSEKIMSDLATNNTQAAIPKSERWGLTPLKDEKTDIVSFISGHIKQFRQSAEEK